MRAPLGSVRLQPDSSRPPKADATPSCRLRYSRLRTAIGSIEMARKAGT